MTNKKCSPNLDREKKFKKKLKVNGIFTEME